MKDNDLRPYTDEIKRRVPIESIIGSYVRLERSNNLLKCMCPFHQERTASFFVYRGGDPHYHCYGCGLHGDVIAFVMAIEGLDFTEAYRRLALRCGISPQLPKPPTSAGRKRQWKAAK